MQPSQWGHSFNIASLTQHCVTHSTLSLYWVTRSLTLHYHYIKVMHSLNIIFILDHSHFVRLGFQKIKHILGDDFQKHVYSRKHEPRLFYRIANSTFNNMEFALILWEYVYFVRLSIIQCSICMLRSPDL